MATEADFLNDDQYASDAANLPALRKLREGDWNGLMNWANAVNQHLSVRRGNRGQFERTATMRDLANLALQAGIVTPGTTFTGRTPSGNISVAVKPGPGNTFNIDIEAFSEELKKTKLWKRLMSDIKDPARFDDLPEQVRLIVTGNLAEQGLATLTDIQRVESQITDSTKSLALQSEQLTASFNKSVAGIRTTQFAFASASRAQAGQVTTITARIDDVDGAGATIEEAYLATADLVDGLEAQYTIKVTAGGAVAGIGLGATSSAAGNATSAIIIQADRFAVVGSSYSGGQTLTPGAGNLPFAIDTGTGNVYMSGNLLVGGTITSTAVYIGTGNTPNGKKFEVRTNGLTWIDGLVAYDSIFERVSTTAAANFSGNSGQSIYASNNSAGNPTIYAENTNGSGNALYTAGNIRVGGTITLTSALVKEGGGSISATVTAADYAATAGEVSIAGSANVTSTGGSAFLRALNGTHYAVVQATDGNLVLYVSGVVYGSAFGGFPSDPRMKDGIAPTGSKGLDVVNAYEVVDFFWKPGTPQRARSKNRKIVGFSAKQIAAVTPGLVSINRGPDGNDEETLLLNKTEMIPYIVKAVQEMDAENKALRAQVAALVKKVGL